MEQKFISKTKSIVILNWIQLVVWLIICSLIFSDIFLNNSPDWDNSLKVGIGIQFGLLILTTMVGEPFDYRWFIYDLIVILLLLWSELESRGIMRTGLMKGDSGFIIIYLFILLFPLSLFFIIASLRKSKLK